MHVLLFRKNKVSAEFYIILTGNFKGMKVPGSFARK